MSIAKTTLALVAAAVVTLSAASIAKAEGAAQDFTLHNATGASLSHLYISPASEDKWGDDIMPDGKVLPDGNEVGVHFNPENDVCKYDIRAEFEDGKYGELREVDLCSTTDVTFNAKEDS